MNVILRYLPFLSQGVQITLSAWLFAGSISIALGTILGIASARYCNLPIAQKIIRFYTFVTKGVPAYVQILIFYFVIPALLQINISGFIAASIALAFCSSGYVTEIVRSSINAIDAGQWEAATVLGYSKQQTITKIILPQAFKVGLPALIGEMEQLIKSTSLLATIGVSEITRIGMDIVSRELTPLPVYCSIAIIYLFFSICLNSSMMILEKRMSYGRY